jgi:putative addiction module component (TIGR02574 family)
LPAFAVQDTVVIRTNLVSDYGGMNMAASLKEIEQQARALVAEERAKLAEVLLESLQTPPLSDIEAEWTREIEDRVAAFDRGETQTYAAEDVFAEARRLSR